MRYMNVTFANELAIAKKPVIVKSFTVFDQTDYITN